MNKRKFDFIHVLIFFISLIYIALAIFLPETPMIEGIVLSTLLIFLILWDKYIPRITNTPENSPRLKTLKFINRFTMCILVIVTLATILAPINSPFFQNTNEKFTVGFISIIMMVLGNKMPQVKRNWYFGLRLPWTCRDEDSWRASHKLLGYTSFPFAIAQFTLSFFISAEKAILFGILGWVGLSTIYSLYIYIKKHSAFI